MNGSLVQVDGGISSGDLEATWDFGWAHGGDGNPLWILGSAFNVLIWGSNSKNEAGAGNKNASDLHRGGFVLRFLDR